MALLVKRLDVNVGDVPHVIVTCCILHNICDTHLMKVLEGVETSRDTAAQDDRSSPSECGVKLISVILYHIVVYYVQSDR